MPGLRALKNIDSPVHACPMDPEGGTALLRGEIRVRIAEASGAVIHFALPEQTAPDMAGGGFALCPFDMPDHVQQGCGIITAVTRQRPCDGCGESVPIDDVARIVAAAMARVHAAEQRLTSVSGEARALRSALDTARECARRDPLTELPNRRAFEEVFECRRRDGQNLCVAVCDVDYFKRINDRFGHLVGDEVLKNIGRALSRACPGSFVARYGGEEFAVLFSGMSVEQAAAALDGARGAVARCGRAIVDGAVSAITFSAGIATAWRGEGLNAVYARADRLLYEAKRAGRNCTCIC